MGIPVIFHHFRHTALSRLQVILDGDETLVSAVVTYPNRQIEGIKQALGGLDKPQMKRDIYWAIAGFAGHLTPETTFSNYLHFSDRIAASKIQKGIHLLTPRIIKEITGFSSHLTTRIIGEQNSDAVSHSMVVFAEPIRKRLGKYTHTVSRIKNSTSEQTRLTDNEDKFFYGRMIPTAEICYEVLKEAEQNASLHELVLRFNIDEEIIQKWLERAKVMSSITTSKNRSRLFSRYKTTPPSGIKLAPPKPQSDIELTDANQAIDKLRMLYHDHKDEIRWCIDYFLHNTNKSKAGLHFSSPEDLDRYLSLMVRVFPRGRWQLTLLCPKAVITPAIIELWQKSSHHVLIKVGDNRVLGGNKYPKGKMQLFLSHPDEKFIKSRQKIKQYSTNVVTYIFHLLKIMV
jgi:hypothetical protein